ncbi:MAG TPA: hypothetical protein VH371_06015, partial [Candidatus Limnocylindrales bacterium]
MTRTVSRTLVFLFFFIATSSARSQTAGAIRGFTTAHAETERQTEERFRAIPKPDNLRAYMQLIS